MLTRITPGNAVRHHEPDAPTSLYRLYDVSGRLLYVGIAFDPEARWRQHRPRRWWKDVASKTVVLYGTRREAEAAESAAIRTEAPLHNIQGAARSTEALGCAEPITNRDGCWLLLFHHDSGRRIARFDMRTAARSRAALTAALRRAYPHWQASDTETLLAKHTIA